MIARCEWPGDDPLLTRYHDQEWGVPLHDDRKLFEFLILEGAQAGLSWMTILRKRENYRLAFDDFDAQKIAAYDDDKAAELLSNPGIVRNRLKVASATRNAKAVIALQGEIGSFDEYVWSYVDGAPRKIGWASMDQIPATSPESDAMSKDLKKRGFNFVGSTILYAFMQATGLVNDHVVDCFRYNEVS